MIELLLWTETTIIAIILLGLIFRFIYKNGQSGSKL